MEYCCGKKFSEGLQSGISEGKALAFFRQIVLGLAHIHSKGYIHRDLSINNILLDDLENVKIADFGLVRCLVGASSCVGSGCVGTPPYIAPECLKLKPVIDQKVDIYSLGILFFLMLHPLETIEEDEPVILDLKSGKMPSAWSYNKYNSRIFQMIAQNPSDRPSAMDILEWEDIWSSKNSVYIQSLEGAVASLKARKVVQAEKSEVGYQDDNVQTTSKEAGLSEDFNPFEVLWEDDEDASDTDA